MKLGIAFGISVSLAAFLAACGASSDASPEPCIAEACDGGTTGDSAATDSAVTDGSRRDSGVGDSGGRDGAAGVCAPRCTTDAQCVSTCPGTAVYCCDFPTGLCYASGTATCEHPPVGVTDSGGLPYTP